MFDQLLAQYEDFYTWENVRFFARAMGTTLVLTLMGCGIGFAFGAAVGLLRQLPGWRLAPLRWLAILYVETFRRIPFLVLLFMVLFVTKAFGADFSLFTIACLGIVIFSTAFLSEIVRAGLESVHQNQWDAAAAMNFSWWQSIRHVIFPQAWKVILPPGFAFFVLFIKDTSLTSQVGVYELTQAGKYFNQLGYSSILSFGTILVLYFVLSYPLTRLGWWIEARLKARGRSATRSTVEPGIVVGHI